MITASLRPSPALRRKKNRQPVESSQKHLQDDGEEKSGQYQLIGKESKYILKCETWFVCSSHEASSVCCH